MEILFWKLQRLVVKKNVEDNLSRNETKNDRFSIRFLYCSFSRGPRDPFLFSIVWRTWALAKIDFDCLILRQNSNS